MQYTIYKEADKKISKDMEIIVKEIRREIPDTISIESVICLIKARFRPSLKLGTHSMIFIYLSQNMNKLYIIIISNVGNNIFLNNIILYLICISFNIFNLSYIDILLS